jgi:hypothetical protein
MPTALDANGEVVICLPDGEAPLAIRTIHGLKAADVVAAFRLVEAHLEPLQAAWRRYHG